MSRCCGGRSVTSRSPIPITAPPFRCSSTLHCYRGQSQLYSPLKTENRLRDGCRPDDSCSEDLPPRYLVLPAKERDGHRHCLAFGSERERQREQKFVPAIDERENPGRRQARYGEREENPGEALSSRGAVNVRRFLEILRNLSDGTREYPDRERHREGHIRHDQAWICIDQ